MRNLIPNLVSRKEWRALTPQTESNDGLGGRGKWRGLGEGPQVPTVVFSNTQTHPCSTKDECINTVQKLQLDHMKRLGLADIRYNFLIGGDGNIYEGRGWHDYADDKALEVALIEDFGSDEDASYYTAMMDKFASLVIYGIHNGFVHRGFDIVDKIILPLPKSNIPYIIIGAICFLIALIVIFVYKRKRIAQKI